jgi:hypothetical protein
MMLRCVCSLLGINSRIGRAENQGLQMLKFLLTSAFNNAGSGSTGNQGMA